MPRTRCFGFRNQKSKSDWFYKGRKHYLILWRRLVSVYWKLILSWNISLRCPSRKRTFLDCSKETWNIMQVYFWKNKFLCKVSVKMLLKLYRLKMWKWRKKLLRRGISLFTTTSLNIQRILALISSGKILRPELKLWGLTADRMVTVQKQSKLF